MNPISHPHPICQADDGHLDLHNIDVWLWVWAIAPEPNPRGVFETALWSIFLKPGRWKTLITDMLWTVVIPDTLWALVTQWWTWQGDLATVDANFLVKWLGLFWGHHPQVGSLHP